MPIESPIMPMPPAIIPIPPCIIWQCPIIGRSDGSPASWPCCWAATGMAARPRPMSISTVDFISFLRDSRGSHHLLVVDDPIARHAVLPRHPHWGACHVLAQPSCRHSRHVSCPETSRSRGSAGFGRGARTAGRAASGPDPPRRSARRHVTHRPLRCGAPPPIPARFHPPERSAASAIPDRSAILTRPSDCASTRSTNR